MADIRRGSHLSSSTCRAEATGRGSTPCNQGVLASDALSNVLTNDPDESGAADATCIEIADPDDFGYAPDSYDTTAASGGAWHSLGRGLPGRLHGAP